MAKRPWRAGPKGLAVAVRLTPKAGRDGIDGVRELADGRTAVAARVRAVPEGGQANAALIKLLAKQWGVAKADLSVVAGATARVKRILVAGDADALALRLENWLKAFAED